MLAAGVWDGNVDGRAPLAPTARSTLLHKTHILASPSPNPFEHFCTNHAESYTPKLGRVATTRAADEKKKASGFTLNQSQALMQTAAKTSGESVSLEVCPRFSFLSLDFGAPSPFLFSSCFRIVPLRI